MRADAFGRVTRGKLQSGSTEKKYGVNDPPVVILDRETWEKVAKQLRADLEYSRETWRAVDVAELSALLKDCGEDVK